MTVISDTNGVSNSFSIARANKHDSKIALEQLNYFLIDPETERVENNNKFKQNMFGDSAYFTKKIYDILKKKGYTPITDTNIRRTKNKHKLKKLRKTKK